MAELVELPPDVRATHLAHACAGLFREAECRRAWLEFDRVAPEARAQSLMRACRQAYCPWLTPRPAACQVEPDGLEADQRLASWYELVARILERDLGRRRAERLRVDLALALVAFDAVEVAGPGAGARGQAVEARLVFEPTAAGARAWVVHGERRSAPLELSARPGLEELGPALDTLANLGVRQPEVELRLAPDLPYVRVIELMEALRAVGLERIMLSAPEQAQD
jgi:hypothetical protein